MRQKRFAGRVGLFVVMAVVVGAVLLFMFSKTGGPFNPTYELRLKAETVGGLQRGAVVLLSGVVIGRVEDADVAPGGRGVHIRVRIKEKYRIHSDARFVVQTIGTAIRALFGVERDHNAHMVRVILRDIFGHGVNITQIAAPQRQMHQRSQRHLGSSSVL